MDTKNKNLLPLNIAARRYGLPRRWLGDEVKAGRLSGLIAEKTILFDESVLVAELLKRTKHPGVKGGN